MEQNMQVYNEEQDTDDLIDDESFDLENPDKYRIDYHSSDQTVEGLYSDYKDGDLILHPGYQRNFVWDKQKASNLIESLLLNIPIPIIFTAESGLKEEVIDGQQRLTSIFSFIDGNFPDGKDFKLSKLKIFKNLTGKKFNELDEIYKKRIKKRTLAVINIKASSQENIKFEMFERLNTNITKLNAQELRNCMYRGSLNDKIKELAQSETFQQLTTTKNERMGNEELVLTFVAFLQKDYHQYKGSVKSYLNDYMNQSKNIGKQELLALEKQFKKAVDLTKHIFGNTAFRVFNIHNTYKAKEVDFD